MKDGEGLCIIRISIVKIKCSYLFKDAMYVSDKEYNSRSRYERNQRNNYDWYMEKMLDDTPNE